MKRDESLVRLSREHHAALILARLLQTDAPQYKGLPADVAGKAVYAQQFYHSELVKHFEDEEKVFSMVESVNEELRLLVAAIVEQHRELHRMFTGINDDPDIKEHLDRLGKLLELHIRKEERELFPMMERSCSRDMLTSIGEILSAH